MKRVTVIDSHTGGEPTRVVIAGGPDLGTGPLAERVIRFRRNYDDFRKSVVLEPRGSDVMVGAILVEPHEPDCAAGVIFFNNVDYLGMCGHGTIGLIVTLAHLGRIGAGIHRIDTPVGVVTATLHEDGSVSITNVPSRRTCAGVDVEVPGVGSVTGDVAWGGNWFFLVTSITLRPEDHVEALTTLAWSIRQALNRSGFPEIDHIELFGPGLKGGDSRNFVLCPGKAYDRSPCGTGTSAKLACLASAGKLNEGETWVQESIVGSSFRCSFIWSNLSIGEIIPTITGEAHIMAESNLCFDPSDPFANGIS
jgi:4-hydroxyproline epimerase